MSIQTKKKTFLKPDYRYINADKFPNISKPCIIDCFSVDNDRNFLSDYRNLKYLKIPENNLNLKLDLNIGYENVKRKPETAANEKLDHLLKFIINNKKSLVKDEKNNLLYNFVCFRGLLRLIMCTPYLNRENWIILAIKYNGTIYLCAEETEEQRHERTNMNSYHLKCCSYGFKFEQYLLSDKPNEAPDTTSPVLEGEEFGAVYETNLEKKRILFGAEMDGIKSDKELNFNEVINWNDKCFIELKTKRYDKDFRQQMNFYKFKLRNWWCQSFLVGIDECIVGLRDDHGCVTKLETMYVRDMPKLAKGYWKPAICLKFCSDFLDFVNDTMETINCPYTVYKFQWTPNDNDSITHSLYVGKDNLRFIPDWYITAMKQL